MTSNVEYRSVIKFLILRQTESSSIIEQLQEAYGDVCPSRATIYNWIREFRHGRQSVFDADREGRPIEISAEKHVLCEKIIVSERRISIRELAQSLHISRGSTETILKDLGILKLCSRFGFFKTTRQFTPPTRPQALWTSVASKCCNIRHTAQTWLQVTLLYSATSKNNCGATNSPLSMICRKS